METWISDNNQQRLNNSSEPVIESCHDNEALPEPESWQLEDFEDILPQELGEFETEYDSVAAYCY